MPLSDDAWRGHHGEGMTPIIRFDEDLLLKMDYFMPTLSFKDRGAAVLVSHCRSIGVNSVVQDSSGNAGNSVAAYCGRVGIECEIFVPEEAILLAMEALAAKGIYCEHTTAGNYAASLRYKELRCGYKR